MSRAWWGWPSRWKGAQACVEAPRSAEQPQQAPRGPLDRFQFDGDDLDEIVLSGVTFHIERMSHHDWWLGVHDPQTNEHLSLWWRATGEPVLEADNWEGAEVVNREPLAYWCPERWTDRRGAEHQCDVEKSTHTRHRCECGATTAVTRGELDRRDLGGPK